MDGTARCNLCGATTALLYADCRDFEYFMTSPGQLHRCTVCGLVMMHPLPTREELPGLYPPSYHSFDAPSNKIDGFLLRRYQSHQAALCRKHLPAGGSVLEIGCATGDVLAALGDDYPTVAGIELSKEACQVAWDRGLDVFHGTLDEYETTERFDLVFMSQVIEHVLDPVATVTTISRLLKPGGTLYIETPNIGAFDAKVWKQRWGLIHYPRHLYLFDKRTIRTLMAHGGLETQKVRSEPQSCGWALSVQGELRRRGIDRNREPRSGYYPALLVAFLAANAVDVCLGGTAFMSAVARKPQ